jgi:nucleoid-associated protein YgaU
MTIFSGSRYLVKNMVNGVTTEEENLRYHPLQETTDWDTDNYESYITRAGDTFESLAFRFYSDANKWDVIANANPEVFWPLGLPAGVELKIPPISKAALR